MLVVYVWCISSICLSVYLSSIYPSIYYVAQASSRLTLWLWTLYPPASFSGCQGLLACTIMLGSNHSLNLLIYYIWLIIISCVFSMKHRYSKGWLYCTGKGEWVLAHNCDMLGSVLKKEQKVKKLRHLWMHYKPLPCELV